MDVREKLVDVHGKLMGLLQRAPYIRCEDVHRQYAVNWLMNNGVTVQEWISVKDRLPEVGKRVLILGNRKDGQFIYIDQICADGNWLLVNWEVTHWMPLPEPPEEVRK